MVLEPSASLLAIISWFLLSTTTSTSMTTSSSASNMASSTSSSSSAWPIMTAPSSTSSLVQRDSDDNLLSVIGNMNYVTPDTQLISTRRDTSGSDQSLVGAKWLPTDVIIQNARKAGMALDVNGFELQKSVAPDDLDFLDVNEVVKRYYPICEELVHDALMKNNDGPKPTKICRMTVKAFDHNVRSSSSSNQKMKNSKDATVQNPAGLVHADYTRVSAPKRLVQLSNPPKINDVLKEQIEASSSSSLLDPIVVQNAIQDSERKDKEGKSCTKYAFVNVWRNIDKAAPVQQFPLACIDALSTSFDELRTFQIHYQDRIGENYFACPPSTNTEKEYKQHSWYYYPEMKYDEVLLLKQWDVRGDLAKGLNRDGIGKGDESNAFSSFTVHSAFMDPSSPEDAPTRQSIEVRCVAIWEEEVDSNEK